MVANVAGRPCSVTVSGQAGALRALRAKRSSQDKRQCARCAGLITCSLLTAVCSAVGRDVIATSSVSLRTTLSQLRRMTAGPIPPQDRATRQETCWLRQSLFRLENGCSRTHLMRRERPENGTDPSWFGGGKAFLTVGTQRT